MAYADRYAVKRALALGRRCNIVVKDWLEDCLITCEPSKKRCRAEKGYTINRILQRVNKSHEATQNYRESFEKGVRAGHEMVDNSESHWSVYQLPLKGPKSSDLSHIYVDPTGFEYKIVCTRLSTIGKVKSEKYTIYVCTPSLLHTIEY
jgi:hypothetical protein